MESIGIGIEEAPDCLWTLPEMKCLISKLTKRITIPFINFPIASLF